MFTIINGDDASSSIRANNRRQHSNGPKYLSSFSIYETQGSLLYIINISVHNISSTTGYTFDLVWISIPVGMIVIWFNNDITSHSDAMISDSTYKPPEPFQSGLILGTNAEFGTTGVPLLAGGSFTQKFTKPGVYLYTDNLNPTLSKDIARISVGNATDVGKNIYMVIGRVNTITSDPSHLSRFVVAFVPKIIGLLPVISMTYNVTYELYWEAISRTFDDRYSILEVKFAPRSTTASTACTANSSNASQSTAGGTSSSLFGP